jgi:hypothetical protein
MQKRDATLKGKLNSVRRVPTTAATIVTFLIDETPCKVFDQYAEVLLGWASGSLVQLQGYFEPSQEFGREFIVVSGYLVRTDNSASALSVPEEVRTIDEGEASQISVSSSSIPVKPIPANEPIGVKTTRAAKSLPTNFENQRDLLRCLCTRHNIGGYTPDESQRFDKIDHDFYIKFTCEGSYGIDSRPNLVGPFGFILANDDESFPVCITSTWPWTKYDLPRVTRREVIKPGMIRYSKRGEKRQSPPRHFHLIEGGDPKRELEALKAIGLRPLLITAKDIREKWQRKTTQELRDSAAPYKDTVPLGIGGS